jgi:hypothetical protein
MKNKLWCDLNTPKEKAEYIRSGMAWQKGIIAYAITNDVARAFDALAEKSSESKESLDDLTKAIERLQYDLEADEQADGLLDYCD